MGAIHRSERHYPEPAEFRPERFLDARVDPSTWFPFGGGVRRCLGATFAGVEMRIVLREVLRRMELTVTEAPAERVRMHNIMMIPGRGAMVTVARGRARGPASESPPGETSGAAPAAR